MEEMSAHSPLTSAEIGRIQKEATRLAKLRSIDEKALIVAQQKDAWAKEKEEKLALLEEKRNLQQKLGSEANQRGSEIRKMKAAMRLQDERRKRDNELDMLETANLDRAHTAAVLSGAERDRLQKDNMMTRILTHNSRDRYAEFMANKKLEREELLAAQHDDFVNVRDARQAEEDSRREMLYAKGIAAQEQRANDLVESKNKLQERNDMLEYRRIQSLAMALQEQEDDYNRRKQASRRRKGAIELRGLQDQMTKAKQDEEVDALNFRRDTILHKAAVESEDQSSRRQSLIEDGEAAQADRITDLQTELERQFEGRDIHNFRRELAMTKAAKARADADLIRLEYVASGEAARADRMTDEEWEKMRQQEEIDIINSHGDYFYAKIAKERADGDKIRMEYVNSGEVARQDRTTDEAWEKMRQDEEIDIINSHHDYLQAKAMRIKANNDQARRDYQNTGNVAKADRKIDEQFAEDRLDERRDINDLRAEYVEEPRMVDTYAANRYF